MKYFFIILCFLFTNNFANNSNLINSYSTLQNIEFKLYTKDIVLNKPLSGNQTMEGILMYDILHAVWENGKWIAYTTNKNFLGTYKIGSPTIIQNSNSRKLFFIANFPDSKGGTDLYMSEYIDNDNSWTKPKNMGKNINTPYNESNPGMLDENTLTYSSNGIIKKIDINTFVIDNNDDEQLDYTVTLSDIQKMSLVQEQKLAEQKKAAELKLTEIKLAEKKLMEEKLALQKQMEAAENEQPTIQTEKSMDDLIDAIMLTAQKLNAQNQSEIETELKTTAPITNIPQTEQIIITESPKPSVTQAPIITPETVTAVTINNHVKSLGKISVSVAKTMFPLAIQIGAYMNPNWAIINQVADAGGQLTTFQNESNLNIVWLTGFTSNEKMLNTLNKVKANDTFKQAFVVK